MMEDTFFHDKNEVIEFYSPFAHLPGRFEVCRIHSTIHGSFDCFICLHDGVNRPVTVYVCSKNGVNFMNERFPESKTILVDKDKLTLYMDHTGRTVAFRLIAEKGLVREANLIFRGSSEKIPKESSYGNREQGVWGGRFYCVGVDLVITAELSGVVIYENGEKESFTDRDSVVTLGSVGILGPLEK